MAPQNQQQKPKEKEYHLNFLAPYNQPEPTEHLNKIKSKRKLLHFLATRTDRARQNTSTRSKGKTTLILL